MNETEQQNTSADATIQPNVQQEAAPAVSTTEAPTAPAPEEFAPQEAESMSAPQVVAEMAVANPGEKASDFAIQPSQCEDASSTSTNMESPTAESEAPNQEENAAESDSPNSSEPEPTSGVDMAKAITDTADRLDNLLASIQSMTERISAIESAFPILRKDVLSLAKSVSGLYTTTTDRMHAKIEKYDRGLEQTIAKPYLLSIAKIGDALRRSIAEAEANPENALAQLQSLKDDIRVPLWNAGLRVIEIEPGVTAFNPRFHDGIDIVATGNKALDGIVESVVENGYLFAPETDDPNARPRVFRAALVKVFKFDKTLESPISSSDEQPTSVN